MEDQADSGAVLGQSRSDSKLVRQKRSIDELGEREDLDARKRVKMRDLDSMFQTDGFDIYHSKFLRDKEPGDQSAIGDEEVSRVTKVPSHSSLAGKCESGSLPVAVHIAPRELDLNSEVCNTNNLASDNGIECADNSEKSYLLEKQGRVGDNNRVASKGIGLDLNAEDVSSSVNEDPRNAHKKQSHLRSSDVSECVSTTAPLDEKDPLKVWKEMKQNGFLSSSHGGITVQSGILSSSHGGIPVPKQRGRKGKQEVIKKKMELAKKEQVDRFTKIAAPSGLLNDLNPGIINHVRNKKQVHSIIEAIVRSERLGNGHSGSKQASQKDVGHRKGLDYTNDSIIHRQSFSHEDGPATSLSGSVQAGGHSVPLNRSFPSVSDDKSGDDDSVGEDDTLALKLSSYMKATDIPCSNEESANFATDSSLTVKAATVASQWLELIHQDIKGRLSALRRSKKRVRAVITTELPFLIAKEFSSNQENDPRVQRSPAYGFSNNAMADMHRARWSTMFDQMDNSLSEEEKQLESWLNQVKEMQLHCDQGLQLINCNLAFGSQKHGTSENDYRSGKVECPEKELAIRAAAASIYSTCRFLLSKENICCF